MKAQSIRRMAPRALDSRAVRVTPKMAKEYLEGRVIDPQRNLRLLVIDQYARDMEAGNWQYIGDSIVFNEMGQMTDGQHRCAACVKSGVSFDVLIVKDIATENMRYMDSGIKRTKGDAFKILGVQNSNVMAAAYTWLFYYRRSGNAHFSHACTPSNAELIDLLSEEPKLQDFMHYSRKAKAVGRPTMWVTFAYLFGKKDKELALSFMERALEGVGVGKGDPVKLLRDQLLSARATRRPMHERELCARVIKTWNACRSGKRVANLRFDHEREEFPKIH